MDTVDPGFMKSVEAAYLAAKRYDVIDDVALRYAIADAIVQALTGEDGFPPVSGYRSPARQLRLIWRWKAGKRDGMIARPASRSWHMQGRAIDVVIPAAWRKSTVSEARRRQIIDTSDSPFPLFVRTMEAMGMRWGGWFSGWDPVHFDLPGPKMMTAAQIIAKHGRKKPDLWREIA